MTESNENSKMIEALSSDDISSQVSLYESSALKQASEVVKRMSMYESPAFKQASQIAKQMSLYESSALRQSSLALKSFALQEAASLMATKSLSSMFVANDFAAIQTVKEMSDYILQQNLAGILDTSDIDAGFEINADVIEDAVTQFSTAPSPENKSGILDWFDTQSPSTQLIIGLIFSYWIGVFCNLSMPLYEDWSQLFSNTSSRVAPKLVVNEARKEYDLTDLKSYRFVVASILHVRSNPTINSEILDELTNGKNVKFIEKSKRWVLVEYLCDETGEYRTGWVFARYLHRFEI